MHYRVAQVAVLAVVAAFSTVNAHVALWDKGMFGLNYPDQVDAAKKNWNNNLPVNPLRESDGFTVNQWFAHGYKGFPPKSGDFMELPAGGRYSGDVHCNRYGTRTRNPNITTPLPQYACDTVGQLHVMNTYGQPVDYSKFGGTALAIAYTSDVASLQPNDMTVISVNHNSVWEREIFYDIPAGLPPCPPGGCLCTWNWIHQSSSLEGYANEIYNILYRCQVTGSTNPNNVVQRGQVPLDCESNPADCVRGPKTPMYVYQAEGNNIPRLYRPPLYRSNWGFNDGAQNDIFTAGSSPAPTTYIVNAYATGTATTRTTPAPSATALPAGWTEMGCMVDNHNTRALDGGSTTMGNLTIQSCVASCASRGFKYAGVEYGNQCFCGNNLLSNTAPASECNVRCPGDQYTFCGGSYRLNVYRSASAPATYSAAVTGTPTPIAASAVPTGWSALGCHADRLTPRVMDGGSTFSHNMTVATCIADCAGKRLPYAGLENGLECWCGRNVELVPVSEGCDARCGGDSNVLCGGKYRINMFYSNAIATAPAPASASSTTTGTTTALGTTSTTSSPTTQPTIKSSSTTTYTTTTKTTTSTTTTSSKASTTTTTAKSSTTITTSKTITATTLKTSTTTTTSKTSMTSTTSKTTTTPKSSTTTKTSTTSPSPTAILPSGWRYLGCTIDSATKRVLNGSYSESTSQTTSSCLSICQSRGFAYAGTQYGRQCHCGNSISNANMVSSGCTTPCPGDKSSTCGGYYRMSLYTFKSGTKVKRDDRFAGRKYPPQKTGEEED